jgi:hypothetical protein
MPATVRVESGISAGTSYWVDRAVLRIGSDPQCDICLPSAELAPHAITLEHRDGVYRAYNRGASPLRVGASLVEPGTNAVWKAADTIHLPGDLRLALAIDGDPRPSPRPESRPGDGFADDEEPLPQDALAPDAGGDAAAKKSSSSLVQIAVIVVCVLGMAGLLMSRGGGDQPAADRPTFNGIVLASLDKDDATRETVRRLQYAEAALVRGHHKLARERFLKLRNQLIHHNDSPKADEETAAETSPERILAYVEYRIGELQ